jgi:hypothetical protein
MKPFLLGVTLLVSASLGATQGNEKWAWKLLHFTRTNVATSEAMETFGKAPSGYLQLGRDGRMMMLVVKDERPSPAEPEKMTDQQRGTFQDDDRVWRNVHVRWQGAAVSAGCDVEPGVYRNGIGAAGDAGRAEADVDG